ncbi:hypothetical protein M422DRAFT_263893 [Sphaerobolus stellatus SS14]|uniref:Uncharacterized protein n=1 Tax=Sphaerobolus stellatus (strain SS14) TaxID=990650 RepID=A0A0C9UGZ6_SPHS4|nr:hypothetical protein M422DRAFT_263893 [Sphaerobolus stellatus SS14]
MEDVMRLQEKLAGFAYLKEEVKGLQVGRDVLEGQVQKLEEENKALKLQVEELEERVAVGERSMRSVIVHDLTGEEEDQSAMQGIQQPQQPLAGPSSHPPTPRAPSPSAPTLGKRPRLDTPDTSSTGTRNPIAATDPDQEALTRITKPMKKKPRLDPDEDGEGGGLAFSFFGINTSTPRGAGVDMSTPRLEGRSVKKMGGFRALGRVGSDLVEKGKDKEDVEEDMEAYLKFDDSGEAELDAAHKDDEDADRQPHTPPPRPSSTAPLSPSRNPSFFSHLPLFHPPTPGLPFPLLSTSTPTSRTTSLNTNTMGVEPKTPPSTHTGMGMDEVDTAQYATPRLGEPFKPEMMSPFGPVGPGAGTNASAGGIGRRDRERSDKFNPYYTPGQRRRSSGRSVSMAFSLGSPTPVTGLFPTNFSQGA